MKIRVFNIVWDTDGDYIEDLPTEVIIDNPTDEMLDCVGGYDDEVADYLSDEYGWCIESFEMELCQ